ncbi:MAG: NUDIX hydrolase [Opitutus sp.]|nr:NUDIX hydrolase [Opitutus sp.]
MSSTPHCSAPVRLTDERFVNLFATSVQRGDKTSRWVFASRRANPGPDVRPDGVLIIARASLGGVPHLVLTREYRVPLGAHELAVPAGLLDEGESAEEAARREFREETGMTLTRVVHVSPPLASSAGLTDETVVMVYGEAEGAASRDHQMEDENIEVRLFTVEQVQELVRHGTPDIVSARLYPVLVAFAAAGSLAPPFETSR